MSVRWTWTAENVSIQNFRESQATAMALDSTGDYVLLAGRRGLEVLRLPDMPQCQSTRVRHKTTMKWDISVAEWNPHAANKHQFVTASNQTADVFTLQESDYVQELSLKAHTRTISNLNWSVFDASLLATCSVDTYIYLWDTREPKKPMLSFSTFAGAGQVRWNKKDPHCLATVHDGDIRLWDKRKGNQAVKYISAHLSKIYSLDWDPHKESHLLTASEDCTAKVWDTTNEVNTVLEFRTDTPQWKARYTPFGDGIVSITMPQLHVRQREKNLLMWSQSNPAAPIHSFVGHTDDILEFQWRPKDAASIDYHMVTWARDYSLRIWRVEPHLQRLCGVEVPDLNLSGSSDMEILASPPKMPSSVGALLSSSPARSHQMLSGRKDIVSGMVGGDHHQNQSFDEHDGVLITSLEQEFQSVTCNTPQTSIETDLQSRSCLIAVSSNSHVVSLKMTFPPQYPIKVTPNLSFLPETTLDTSTRIKVLEVLDHSCIQQVEMGRFCISNCVNKLITIMEGLQVNMNSSFNGPSMKTSSSTGSQVGASFGTAFDKYIPFPRTSGARFCSTDKLVMFTRPSSIKKSSTTFQPTPKALSALSQYRSQQPGRNKENKEGLSVARFYQDRENKHRRGGKHRRKNSDVSQMSPSSSPPSGIVVVFDTSCLLPIHQKLAETYVLIPDDVPLMCKLNANAAGAVGRQDLVQVWSLASLASSPKLNPDPEPDIERPWARHPMGRQMLKSLMDHYSAIHDVQTLAMLSCAFRDRYRTHSDHVISLQRFFNSSGSDPFSPDWISDDFPHSMSWGESPDDYKFGQPRNPEDVEKELHQANMQLLDPDQRHQLDKFKRKYADILYKWNLLEARAELLKYTTYPDTPKNSCLEFSDFGRECRRCHKKPSSIQCNGCKKYSFECSICHVAVRGASTFCFACGHGGHTQHMLDWFRNETMCPTGCGCECERESLRSCEQNVSSSSPVTPTVGPKR